MRAHGLSIDLPPGWDAEIYRRPLERQGGETHSVLHAANFALPPDRGDFGGKAIEIMRIGHVLIVLFEYGPESVGTVLFEHQGLPRLHPEEFSPGRIHQPVGSQAAAQHFFTAGGRPFCLYAVVGNFRLRSRLIAEIEPVLATVRF